MKVVIRYDVIIARGTNVKTVENGILVDDVILGIPFKDGESEISMYGYNIVEYQSLPSDYVDGKYTKDLTLSVAYQERQAQIEQQAIDDYTEELIIGGII